MGILDRSIAGAAPVWPRLPMRIIVAALAAALAAATALRVEIAGAQDTIQVNGPNRTGHLNVSVGKTQDVRTDSSFVDITVGDPEIADVTPLTDRSLSILGKKAGVTRVSVYGEGKKQVGVFDVVVGYDTSMISSEFARRFPHASLRVSSVNGKIMLSGSAPDAVTVDQAVTIARQFGPDVINSISVASPQQVMLEVRFVEISRRAGKELGVQWNMFGRGVLGNTGTQLPANQLPVTPRGPGWYQNPGVTSGGPNNTTTTRSPIVSGGVLSGTAPFGFLIGRLLTGSPNIDILLNALEEKGVARNLAEPNLVALSGDTASFLAGGEFPVPVPGTLGQVSIEYKRYGVGLAFTPTVLSGGLINLKIEPEVSQLDTSNPVQVAGISVPPLIVRRASTTVELRDGQAFVIGGLLQTINTNDQQQLPWLGDVPVLGTLFRSASYQKNETDLAIIVTPRLVRPARPGDVIKTPHDSTLSPNDADLFLMGKSEITPAMARIAAGVSTRPLSGHILDLQAVPRVSVAAPRTVTVEVSTGSKGIPDVVSK
jgi:pilus assembly protein CpaC